MFLVETIFDTLNAKAAIYALERFFEEQVGIVKGVLGPGVAGRWSSPAEAHEDGTAVEHAVHPSISDCEPTLVCLPPWPLFWLSACSPACPLIFSAACLLALLCCQPRCLLPALGCRACASLCSSAAPLLTTLVAR